MVKISIGQIWHIIKPMGRKYPEIIKIQDIYFNDNAEERIDVMYCTSDDDGNEYLSPIGSIGGMDKEVFLEHYAFFAETKHLTPWEVSNDGIE